MISDSNIHLDPLKPSQRAYHVLPRQSAHSLSLQRKVPPKEFSRSFSKEVHAVRRKEILKTYPQITRLFGPDPLASVFALLTVLVQIFLAYSVRNWDWLPLIAVTYIISGTLNCSLLLAAHELSHDLFFKTKIFNLLMSYVVNLPTGIASAASFRKYHLPHHSAQGQEGEDEDLPTDLEATTFVGKLGKFAWCSVQVLFYAFRPLIMKPTTPGVHEICGWIVCIIFNTMIVKYMSGKALFYLIFGSISGSCLHPLAGHFIAEHLETIPGLETYSYYGTGNLLTYNVGHHIEHHDFPRIAGRRLPLLHKIAPEWYDLPSYSSWASVIFEFIIRDHLNLYCRVKRENPHQKQ